jgi:malate synthase
VPQAIALLDQLSRSDTLAEFLTLPAYAQID